MKLKAFLFSGLAAGLMFSAEAENLLAGKVAVYEQKPLYRLTTDANDPKDLTDGKIQNWLIWNYKSSVGWTRGKSYSFYFDLGEAKPIGKIRLHTSAGRSGVKMPQAIHVYAGDTLAEMVLIDEMIKPNKHLNPEARNAKTTFWIEGKGCPVIARYLKFVVTPSATKDAYFFVDEITAEPGEHAVPVKKLLENKNIPTLKQDVNLLAGKVALYDPIPRYGLTTDANDPKDLTDGHTNTWQIHFYKSSVGWYGEFYVSILFDLGKETDIGEIRLHTSQGHGGVHLPEELLVMAGNSPDEFTILDDMIASNPNLPTYEEGPKVFWVAAKNKHVRARYLKFIAAPHKDSTFFFVDEVYVSPGKNCVSVNDLPRFKGTTKEFIKYSKFQTRIKNDAAMIRENIRLSGSKRSVDALEMQLRKDPASVKQFDLKNSEFPLNPAQIKFAEFQQKLLAEAGYRGLVLWGGNRWDMFHSFQFPTKQSANTTLKMTPGETRSFVVNTANANTGKMMVKFSVSAPFPVEVNETKTSVDSNNFFNANRLQPLKAQGGQYQFDLLPGESSQIFFRIVLPRNTKAGTYPVTIKFADGKVVTAKVQANALKFPTSLSAEYGTWDYLNNFGCHGNAVFANNFKRALSLMRDYQMDLCWGHEIALPFARPDMFDANGKLVKPLDFTKLDQWLNQMKGFKRYALFGGGGLNKRLNFGYLPEKNPEEFTKRLVSYLNALAAHIETVHKLPVDQFRLHFVDEASTPAQKDLLRTWCNATTKAISPSGKKFYSYGNPFFNPKEEIYSYPELNIIQPNPGSYKREIVETFVKADQKRNGKGFTGLYVCANRVRQRDPYMYFGMISRLGILFDNFIGIGFWNIACAANDVCELDYSGRTFSTWYFSGNEIFVSRQAEAILEGREDFEYMLLLKKLIPALKKSNPALAAEGEKLLASIKAEILSELGGSKDEKSLWIENKDRAVADRQRDRIWNFLEKVSRSNPAILKQTGWK